MTIDELRKMDGKKLHAYFAKHARYYRQNPPESQYAILLGGSHLFAEDTAELFQKFAAKIRELSSVG